MPQNVYITEDRARGLFKVSRNAFVSQQVLAEEHARIFERCWLYLGHESELAKPGDFVTRAIAGRNLIFNRDRGGVVNAFYNTCTHRGAFVCREAKGNAKVFQCFYHGWAFSDDGALIDQPGREAYCEGFNDNGASNLARLERLENYRGFYFINFDRNAISLEDYLGDARPFIDLVVDQAETGMEIIGGTQQYAIDANWKLLTENSVDGYHAMTTHATYMDYLGNSGALARVGMAGGAHALGNGHAVIEYTSPWGRPIAQWVPTWGEAAKQDVADIKARLVARTGPEKAERM
ncbi:MAG: aromatic ring-hydroxylating oxygenase subunit alpha, partial [Alphaproteobacteria bacterium]